MPKFIVNKNAQSNGDHEVHNETKGCQNMPLDHNREDLGWHDTCHSAVSQAKRIYTRANGCYYCANECHTS
jgi:hypothetical protein